MSDLSIMTIYWISFQLIVITHDDDLISSLGRAVNDQNFYYKVSRNDRMLSVVKKYKVDDLWELWTPAPGAETVILWRVFHPEILCVKQIGKYNVESNSFSALDVKFSKEASRWRIVVLRLFWYADAGSKWLKRFPFVFNRRLWECLYQMLRNLRKRIRASFDILILINSFFAKTPCNGLTAEPCILR